MAIWKAGLHVHSSAITAIAALRMSRTLACHGFADIFPASVD